MTRSPATARTCIPTLLALALLAPGCESITRTVAPPEGAELVQSGTNPMQLVVGMHHLNVVVRGPGGDEAPNVVVTVTDVVTGEYRLGVTGLSPRGVASFDVPAGSYLVHARNLADLGPAVPLQLGVAPLPNGAPLLDTSVSQGRNMLAGLWDPGSPTGWLELNPANYSAQTVSPPLVFTGPSSSRTITIRMSPGTPFTCTFANANGTPLPLSSTENVFIILPHGNGPLPPAPSALSGLNLPRGILLAAATVPAGQTACTLGGFTGAAGAVAVVETNAVNVNGQSMVFVGQVTAGGGSTTPTNIVLSPEPQRSSIGYLLDPWGDATGPQDIGLVTYGYEAANPDEATVGVRFQGAGDYMVVFRWVGPVAGYPGRSLRAIASCEAGGCSLRSVTPAVWESVVQVTGTMAPGPNGVPEGLVQFTVPLPGAREVEFWTQNAGTPSGNDGLGGISDRAPDGRQSQRIPPGGAGNTWLIPG